MTFKVVSLFDKKAGFASSLTLVHSLDEARRQFLDLCADTSTLVGRHPEDFELRLLGEFESDECLLESIGASQPIEMPVDLAE